MTTKWLLEYPVHPVTAPLTSGTASRSPELLERIVAQFEPETHPRYRARDITGDGRRETFCNYFVRDVTRALGCELPVVFLEPGGVWKAGQVGRTLTWLRDTGHEHGWSNVTLHVAEAMVGVGQVVVAINEGHVCIVLPARKGEPVPWVANVGASNFARGPITRAFGNQRFELWGHP